MGRDGTRPSIDFVYLLVQTYSLGHFRRRGVEAAAALAVGEIDDDADGEPNEQSHPVRPAESVDHRAARYDAERADHRRRRHLEPAFQIRTTHPQDPDSGTDENESEERSDAGHFTGDVR